MQLQVYSLLDFDVLSTIGNVHARSAVMSTLYRFMLFTSNDFDVNASVFQTYNMDEIFQRRLALKNIKVNATR